MLQIKNFLNAITHTVRTVSDNLDTSCKKLDDLVDKVCDIHVAIMLQWSLFVVC